MTLYNSLLDSLTEAYSDFESGVVDWLTVTRIQKSLDLLLVATIYAPMRRSEKKTIKTDFDAATTGIALETKQGLQEIANQMDSSIKGKFGQAITTSMTQKNSEWDKL